jgi:hypothetical protein
MSWKALRYNGAEPLPNRSPRRRQRLTKHHVPPTAVCEDKSGQFILIKSEKDHEAYNRVFGNAKNLKKATEILKAYFQIFGEGKTLAEAMVILEKYWWTPPNGAEQA